MEIRVATPAEAPACLAIYTPLVRDTSISFEEVPPDKEEMAARIERILPQYPWLVATEGPQVLGYAYATTHRTRAAYRWSAEVSVYVGSDVRRRGVGRALYSALFALLARQGYRNAFAGVTLPNDPSVRLHESLGFQPIGVFREIGFKTGAWHDVGWWQRPLAPRAARPPEPVPFARLDREQIEACLRLR